MNKNKILLNFSEHSDKMNREYILKNIDKIALDSKYYRSWNFLMFIVFYNNSQNLGFTKDDFFSILDKFDLSQKNEWKCSIYDFISDIQLNSLGVFNKKERSYLVSKLDIEMKSASQNNILVRELTNGLCFDSEELVQKILNTKNKEIIDCVYQHITQIKWKQDELLTFLKKNELELDLSKFEIL